MSVSAEFVEYIKDLLINIPDLESRKFFGGISLRSDGLQFAMLLNDTFYFVVDDQSRPDFEALDMQPFCYMKKTGEVIVRKYYTAPEHLFDDEDEMLEWAKAALAAARRCKK